MQLVNQVAPDFRSLKRLTISPSRAKEILEDPRRPQNRAIRKYDAAAFRDAYLSGTFVPDTQFLIFRKEDGVLLDGQHRLAGVVEANIDVEFLVLEDGRLEDMLVVDTGRARTLSDVISITRNKPHNAARLEQTVIAHLHEIEKGCSPAKTKLIPNYDKIISRLGQDHLNAVAANLRHGNMALIASAQAAFVFCRPINPAKVDECLLKCVFTTAPLAGTPDAINRLRGRIREERDITRANATHMYMTGIAAYIKGNAIQHIQRKTVEGYAWAAISRHYVGFSQKIFD